MGDRVLVTGGAGYIGTHACIQLAARGHDVVVLDDFSSGDRAAVQKVERFTSRRLALEVGDIRDARFLDGVFQKWKIDSVLHFAGLKSVAESMTAPLKHFESNIGGALTLLGAMETWGVRRLVFSSSAAVYGDCDRVPISESEPARPKSPYARCKLVVEQILGELCRSDTRWAAVCLRYFNAAGAHESGQIDGDRPGKVPENLFPKILRIARGEEPRLVIYGDDYPTHDGTAVRDYVHVMDLAIGHVRALERMREGSCEIVNLGSGRGYSVLEVLTCVEAVTGRRIPFEIGPRRPGDVPVSIADVSEADHFLGWRAERNLVQICRDAWRRHEKDTPARRAAIHLA